MFISLPSHHSRIRFHLHDITRIRHLVTTNEILFDRANRDKPTQQVHAASLIIRAARPRPTKRLLPDNSASALAVDVEVAGRVAQRILREAHGGAVAREHRARQRILRSLVDGAAHVDEGVGGRGLVVVDVHDQHRPEQLAREERVLGVGAGVHRRPHEVARRPVVRAARQQLQVRVGLRVVDDALQLPERGFVDDGPDEVREVGGRPDAQLPRLLDQDFFELGPQRRRHVGAARRAALLPLVLEGAAHGVDGRVAHVRAAMHQVEVLAAGLADDARVVLVLAFGDARGDLAVQASEYRRGSGVVQRCELVVG